MSRLDGLQMFVEGHNKKHQTNYTLLDAFLIGLKALVRSHAFWF